MSSSPVSPPFQIQIQKQEDEFQSTLVSFSTIPKVITSGAGVTDSTTMTPSNGSMETNSSMKTSDAQLPEENPSVFRPNSKKAAGEPRTASTSFHSSVNSEPVKMRCPLVHFQSHLWIPLILSTPLVPSNPVSLQLNQHRLNLHQPMLPPTEVPCPPPQGTVIKFPAPPDGSNSTDSATKFTPEKTGILQPGSAKKKTQPWFRFTAKLKTNLFSVTFLHFSPSEAFKAL